MDITKILPRSVFVKKINLKDKIEDARDKQIFIIDLGHNRFSLKNG